VLLGLNGMLIYYCITCFSLHIILQLLLSSMLQHPYALGGSANARHANSLAGYVAALAKRFEVVMPALRSVSAGWLSVVTSHHSQTGGAAVHGVVLRVVGERHLGMLNVK